MRLTDRPRSLAEMKPDVAWPQQLQAVMDRALSRDAATRYASAAEFGYDFAGAVERMPRTVASEANTSILAATGIPATNVSPAPTRIAPAQATGSPVRRVPFIVGAATVAIGAVVAFGLMRGKRTADAADSGTAPPNVTAGAPANVPARDTTRAARPAATARSTRTLAPSAGQALSPEAISAEIVAIKDLSLDDQRAAEAVRRAEALLPRLRSGDDSAAVLWYQGSAYAMQGDTSRSCRALNKIGSRGNSSIRESVNLLRSQC